MKEILKILGLCIASAIAYGIVNDQVTARICIEYFTVFHPPIFYSKSAAVLGIVWGIIATCWVGVILGVLLVIAARAGSAPKLTANTLVRPIGRLLLFMGACAILLGVAGFVLAQQRVVSPPEWVAYNLAPYAHPRFVADWWAHIASYASGTLGGLILSS